MKKLLIKSITIIAIVLTIAAVMANKNIQFKVEFNTFTPDKVAAE